MDVSQAIFVMRIKRMQGVETHFSELGSFTFAIDVRGWSVISSILKSHQDCVIKMQKGSRAGKKGGISHRGLPTIRGSKESAGIAVMPWAA